MKVTFLILYRYSAGEWSASSEGTKAEAAARAQKLSDDGFDVRLLPLGDVLALPYLRVKSNEIELEQVQP